MAERRVTKTKLIFGFQVILYASIICTYAADTLSANQTIKYNETIVSPQETFELGFFSPGNSKNHYVGIWYKKRSYRTVVWVANRNTPLTHTSGELTLTLRGVLIIRDATMGNITWSSANSSNTSVTNPTAQLLDTGNFIVYDGLNQENPIWQSFDFLSDTLLPGMKYGVDFVTGFERRYTSWKSDDDPAFGEFSYGIDIRGYPQAILMDGVNVKLRGGPWNGLRYTGYPNLRPNPIYNYTFVLNKRETYFRYDLINTSVLMRVVLLPNGTIQRLLWTDDNQVWKLYLAPLRDQCDLYAMCGPFGSCNIENSPVCECLKGFEPKSPEQWRAAESSQGCKRTIRLDCGPGEGFNKYSNLKLPDTRSSWYNQTMTLRECEKKCKSNCSCTAYTNSNISGTGSGCLLWFGDLIDIRTYSENGDTLYIRMPPSELGKSKLIHYIYFHYYLHKKKLHMIIIFWHRLDSKRHQLKCRDKSTSYGPHSICCFGHPSFNILTILSF
ncbi:putative non-specific serine/threonine protein kinase [Helianthus annuus]|nr:putative non-specific serine/threonine protein kinase [Helianthus annuus]